MPMPERVVCNTVILARSSGFDKNDGVRGGWQVGNEEKTLSEPSYTSTGVGQWVVLSLKAASPARRHSRHPSHHSHRL